MRQQILVYRLDDHNVPYIASGENPDLYLIHVTSLHPLYQRPWTIIRMRNDWRWRLRFASVWNWQCRSRLTRAAIKEVGRKSN